ncbi:MAG TPA: hypothetical protein VIW28_06705 [Gemmatimonadales bacterium]
MHAAPISGYRARHRHANGTEAPRFDAGTLTAVVARSDSTSTVTIQFAACGQYTVTKA